MRLPVPPADFNETERGEAVVNAAPFGASGAVAVAVAVNVDAPSARGT